MLSRFSIHLFFPLAALLLLLTGGCQADPYRQKVDALAAPYIEGQYIVGMSVGIVRDGKAYTYHYGLTERGGRRPDDHTHYEIGSITKTFTGLMLADGVVRQRYTLDTPVSKLVPEAAALDDRVTLERLSTHTSGLPRLPANLFPIDPVDPYGKYDEEHLFAYLAKPDMEYEPGTNAVYSNLAVGLLGYAIGREAQSDYATVLKHRVLTPLGMDQTTIKLSDEQLAAMARPHNAMGESDYLWDLNTVVGAGGIRSNLHDMLIYVQAQLQPENTPLAQAIELGQQRHTAPNGPSLGDGTGLGWIFADGGKWLNHNGQTGGYHTVATFNREKQLAIVILTNTSNGYSDDFSSRLIHLLQDEDVKPTDLAIPAQVDPKTLAAYAGQYQLGQIGVLTITVESDRLYAQLTGQPRIRAYPESDTRFNCRIVQASITFSIDRNGKVEKLELHQNGQVLTGLPIPR